jgi:hypothetical protein
MTAIVHQSEVPQVSIELQEVMDRLTILQSQQVNSICLREVAHFDQITQASLVVLSSSS